MRILVVGGGSGGHITPAVSVIREILEKKPRVKIEFWTDKKYYKNVVNITTEIGVHWGEEDKTASEKTRYIRVRKIMAGKLHRYAGIKFRDYFAPDSHKLRRDVIFGNIKGGVSFILGLFQAFFRLIRKSGRPDVIFLKGGFVGLPVGMVASFLKIPYVIHESDVVFGLANRILVKSATVVATGVEYEEKSDKYRWVGIPVAPEFAAVSESGQRKLKKNLGFSPDKQLVIITGGSQGSEHINQVVAKILPELLEKCSVGLVAGRKHYEQMVELKQYEKWEEAKLQADFRMWNFSSVMHEILGAADVVVSRAGATTIAELAMLRKAVILVPFEKLPGGHQVKNAEKLEKMGAVSMIVDSEMVAKPEKMLEEILRLTRSPKKREEMAEKLALTAKNEATTELADILLQVIEKKRNKN